VTRTSFPFAGTPLGTKALGCFGGCDFHGKPHDVYWTHLAKTAYAGNKTIVLQEAVDWEPDDKILITTTGFRYVLIRASGGFEMKTLLTAV